MPDDDLQVFLILVDGCPYCEQAKKVFENEIKTGKIKLLKFDEPKVANEITKQLTITKVPACVIEDKKEKRYYYCSKNEELKQKEGEMEEEQETPAINKNIFSI